MQEIWVQFLSQEDPLEKEMTTHSTILAWETSWTEKAGGLQKNSNHQVAKELGTTEQQNNNNSYCYYLANFSFFRKSDPVTSFSLVAPFFDYSRS